jgi:predicted DNA-binding protein (MmcQ/YjbR family)
MMNIEEYREYCISKKGVTEECPFGPEVLVFKVCGKMFTATDIETFTAISVKCDPEKVEALREQYAAVQIPAYMSKKHWNQVLMNGYIADKLIQQWIDDSYDLVVAKLTKKQRLELLAA